MSSSFLLSFILACVFLSHVTVALQVSSVADYDRSFMVEGGGFASFSTWQVRTPCRCSMSCMEDPVVSNPVTWRTVGDLGLPQGGNPLKPDTIHTLVVRATLDDPNALARPIAMKVKWMSNAEQGGFFEPICPAGYGAIGDVGTPLDTGPVTNASTTNTTITPADFPNLVCVKTTYLMPATPAAALPLTQIWNDTAGRARYHHMPFAGSAWVRPPLRNASGANRTVQRPFLAGDAGYGPPASPAWALDLAKVEMVAAVPGCTNAPTANPTIPPPVPPFLPEQVHLALGADPTKMAVEWVTPNWALEGGPASVARYGPAGGGAGVDGTGGFPSTAAGDARVFFVDANRNWTSHVAVMTGLAPGARYQYQVGDPDAAVGGWSATFGFQAPATAARYPRRHLILGDMGAACAFTMCRNCSCAMNCTRAMCTARDAGLVAEVDAGGVAQILHVGDFGPLTRRDE